MPGIVDRLAATEAARVIADDRALLADDHAIGISLDLDRPADRARADRVLVVVEPHQASLRDRRLDRVEPVEPAADAHHACAPPRRTVRLANSGCLCALA